MNQVAAGLYLSFHGLGRISARVTGSLKSFWSMADYIANTVRTSLPPSLPPYEHSPSLSLYEHSPSPLP